MPRKADKLEDVLRDIISSAEADMLMYREDQDSDNPVWINYDELYLICKVRKHTAEYIKRRTTAE